MKFINHRINRLDQLERVPRYNGIELDIRYHEDTLVLHHDPFGHHRTRPTHFEDLLKHWKHAGPMILNVKTEGIEMQCIDLMNEYGIEDWFFLDLSMPFFAVYAEAAVTNSILGFSANNLAVRFSEREPVEYALAFSGKATWVWVDCFSKLVVNEITATALKAAGFKICLVSPELQQHPISDIAKYRTALEDIELDAVCTKRPDLWGQPTSDKVVAQLESNYPVKTKDIRCK